MMAAFHLDTSESWYFACWLTVTVRHTATNKQNTAIVNVIRNTCAFVYEESVVLSLKLRQVGYVTLLINRTAIKENISDNK